MQGPNTKPFKQAFLKNLLLSLQACTSHSSKAMSLQERKHVIKSSADIAMAAARGSGARWPRALLSDSSKPCSSPCKVQRSKNIVRRCCHKRRGNSSTSTSDIARRLVKKRTKLLRKIVPGGEFLDEVSLLHEALDYVVHLQAQVDVLHRISVAGQRSSNLRGSSTKCTLKEKEASGLRE